MKLPALLFAILLTSSSVIAQSQQYVAVAVRDVNGVYINGILDKEFPYVLVDSLTGVEYILNAKRNMIRAIDSNDKLLWETDPRNDANVMAYRVEDPVIISLSLQRHEWTNNEEVIDISYNNSQFGYLNKETGKFHFEGQD